MRASIGTIKTNFFIFEEKNGILAVRFLKRSILRGILDVSSNLKKIFAGNIKVPGGPHVAHGPEVAQACFKSYLI